MQRACTSPQLERRGAIASSRRAGGGGGVGAQQPALGFDGAELARRIVAERRVGIGEAHLRPRVGRVLARGARCGLGDMSGVRMGY